MRVAGHGRRQFWLCVLAGTFLAITGCSREQVTRPSKETVQRELSAFWAATVSDTAQRALAVRATDTDTAATRFWKTERASLSSTLGALGYGTGPFRWNYDSREEGAIYRFQHDIGIPETGWLDSLTVWNLVRARKALTLADIGLPSLLVTSVGAKGTWVAVTNELLNPVNSVEIVCDFSLHECRVTTVGYDPDEFKGPAIFHTSLPIVHWSPDLVVARYEYSHDNFASLTVDVQAHEVVFTQTGRLEIPTAHFGSTDPFTHDFRDMSLRLVDGAKLNPASFDASARVPGDSVFADAARYIALQKKNFIAE